MSNRTPWTPAENAALVSLYFDMLAAAKAGQTYNKAAMIRDRQNGNIAEQIADDLRPRSRASIEFKLMNASAAHADLIPGAETMHGHGYRAMPNYQQALKDAMRAEINGRSIAEGAA